MGCGGGGGGFGVWGGGGDGAGDFGQDADFVEGGDREDHGFLAFGLCVWGLAGCGGGCERCACAVGRVHACRRGAHREGAVHAWTHEVWTREGGAALVGLGKREGGLRTWRAAWGAVGDVGDAATFGLWASGVVLEGLGTFEAGG